LDRSTTVGRKQADEALEHRLAGLIRQSAFGSKPAFSFADLEQRARQQIAASQSEIDRLLAAARAQAEQEALAIREQARAEGLATGRREGLEAIRKEAQQTALKDARQKLDQLAQALRQALEQYDQQRHALLAQAEGGLIHLALEIARRVCKQAVGGHSPIVAQNALNLLELVGHADDLVLSVHPDDLDQARAALRHWIEPHAPATTPAANAGVDRAGVTRPTRFDHVQLRPDPDAPRGTCVLTTAAGKLDASIEAQLDRIAVALLDGPPSEPQP
jgi:flagellar biosynthesis/type III secretory pathway protein FliH